MFAPDAGVAAAVAVTVTVAAGAHEVAIKIISGTVPSTRTYRLTSGSARVRRAGVVGTRARRTRGGRNTGNSSADFSRGRVINEQVLREDAPLRVVGVVAAVTLGGRIANSTRSECAGFECKLRVATHGCDLLRELEDDGLVRGGRARRGRILVLLDRGDLRVDGLDAGASSACCADRARVTLQSTEDQCVDLGINIPSGLGIRESLVGDSLLQAVRVLVQKGSPHQQSDNMFLAGMDIR